MEEIYLLRNAITFNPTGKKHNAIAKIATLKEIKQHKEFFTFNFELNFKNGIVYKIIKEGDEDMIQGLVSLKPDIGILDCGNMEKNKINKSPLLIHSGLGKCMIALCCKISIDMGFDGYITFESKNRLMPYYSRYGAKRTSGLRMFIDNVGAKKLVENYF